MTNLTGHIDRAVLYTGIEGKYLLAVEGWVLHTDSVVKNLNLEIGEFYRGKTKRVKRVDVAERFKDVTYALECGFIGNIAFDVAPENILDISLCGELDNGEKFRSTISVSPEKAKFDFKTSQSLNDENEVILGSKHSRQTIITQSNLAFEAFLNSGETLSLPKSTLPRVSIILVVHNQAALTYGALLSLKDQIDLSVEIIVVDNASEDQTATLFSRIHGITVIRNEHNQHFIDGANAGANVANGDVLIFLNNDTVVYAGAVANAIKKLNSDPKIGVVGAKLIRPDGKLQEAGSRVRSDGSTQGIGVGEDPKLDIYNDSFEVDYVSGAFLCTRKDIFKSLNGFDSCFSPAYYEDADYCYRARDAGFKVVYEPKSVVLHIHQGSSDSSSDAFALILRNRPIFVSRHLSKEDSKSSITKRANLKSLLYIDDYLPVSSRGQGLPRAELIIRALQEFGYSVSIFATNETSETFSRYSPSISQNIKLISINHNESKEDQLSTILSKYDTIFVSRPHNMEILDKAISKTNIKKPYIIYDAEAVFSLRELQKQKILSGLIVTEEEEHHIISKEVQLARHANLVLSVSSFEAAHFKEIGVPVMVVSHAISVRNKRAGFDARHGMMTVGPLLTTDTPNADAVIWFLKHVTSKLEKLIAPSENIISIIGENKISSEISAISSSARILGQVGSLFSEYDRHKVFFAAHRYSAGVPLKIIEAAANGIPVICSPLLAQQLGWTDEEVCIASSADEWIDRLVTILSDEKIWKQYADNAAKRVAREYSVEKFYSQLDSALKSK